jgi:hypothetical protein
MRRRGRSNFWVRPGSKLGFCILLDGRRSRTVSGYD